MAIDKERVNLLLFDCVNTVFDVSGIGKAGLRRYVNQVRRKKWQPLQVEPSWAQCPAWPDSREGIARLVEGGCIVVPCSNWPTWLLAGLARDNGIEWSAYVPMENVKVYKPDPKAYLQPCRVLSIPTEAALMVTANEGAGDIETAENLGMQAILIDRENKYKGKYPTTIIELAEILNC